MIHNAQFDIGFINAELERATLRPLGRDRLVDTLLLARRKHPGVSNKLDELCRRYGIDNSRRTKHGALLDAELLAEVYLELIGARQASLVLNESRETIRFSADQPRRQRPVPLQPRVSDDDVAAHLAFVAKLGENAYWKNYAE